MVKKVVAADLTNEVTPCELPANEITPDPFCVAVFPGGLWSCSRLALCHCTQGHRWQTNLAQDIRREGSADCQRRFKMWIHPPIRRSRSTPGEIQGQGLHHAGLSVQPVRRSGAWDQRGNQTVLFL